LDYAKRSGASGAQPSNYMLQSDKGFQKAKEIKQLFADRGMTLDGKLTFTSVAGPNYAIESCDRLSPAVWIPVPAATFSAPEERLN
jgi:hypothetical protein